MPFNRASPSPRYRQLTEMYRQLHRDGERFLRLAPEDTFPGTSLPPQAARIKALILSTRAETILDYGSGKGRQYDPRAIVIPGEQDAWDCIQDYWGVDFVHCYDPAFEPYSELPKDRFDGVICTDVLEHCPEEDVGWIVGEIFSYACKFVFANIACYPAQKRLPNGENAHCTIRNPEWWGEVFAAAASSSPGITWRCWLSLPRDAEGVRTEICLKG